MTDREERPFPTPVIAGKSDTIKGAWALWADGSVLGATQIAIIPKEIYSAEKTAEFIADVLNTEDKLKARIAELEEALERVMAFTVRKPHEDDNNWELLTNRFDYEEIEAALRKSET